MPFKILKKIALFFFDLIDKYYHQIRIKNFLKKKKIKIHTFFDIGSHMGTYTDLILENNKQMKAYLFEPQSDIFKKIKAKYKDNQNIKVFNLGISNNEITKELNINLHDLTSTFSNFNKDSKYLNFKAKLYQTNIENMFYKKENVDTITLANFIINNNINSIDLMKIDTEGHELEVLKGLEKQISKVSNILIEFHHRDVFENYQSPLIHNFLVNNGFKLKKIFNFPLSWQDRFYSKDN